MRRWFSEVAFVESDVWIAEADDGLVVGVMAIKDGRIEQLYVDALWTGRRIGSRLIQLSKELHPDGLELWAFVSNARACHFYERHGFVALEQTDGRGNEERAPDVHYAWPARQSGSHGESQDVIAGQLAARRSRR